MKGSRLTGTEKGNPLEHEMYIGSRYQNKSNKHRELYVEKLLEAFRTLSDEAPEVFDSIAPEMLQRSIWSWRGADPLLSKKFNNWILSDYQWTPFKDILPSEHHTMPLAEVPRLDPAKLEAAHRAFIQALSVSKLAKTGRRFSSGAAQASRAGRQRTNLSASAGSMPRRS